MSSKEDYKVDIATDQPIRPRKNPMLVKYQTSRVYSSNLSAQGAIKQSVDSNQDSQDPYKMWTLKEKLSSRRQEIIKRRTGTAFPTKLRSASQSIEKDFTSFVEKKNVFRQEQLKKHYKAIRSATNKYKLINLGTWESDLSNIQKEPEYDFTAPTDAETQKSNGSPQLQKSLRPQIPGRYDQAQLNDYYATGPRPGSQQIKLSSALNSSEFNFNTDGKPQQISDNQVQTQAGTRIASAFVVTGGAGSLPSTTTRDFNTKSSSFVKYHLHGRNPYDVFNDGQQLSIDSVESEIKNALGIKPKFKVDNMASTASQNQIQQEMQISKRLRPSTCNNLMFTKQIARHSSEKQNFFLTTVDNESQIFELQQRRASNIQQLQTTIKQTKKELRQLSNAQHRDKRENYVPPTLDEIVQRNTQEGHMTGIKSTFEQRIDNLRMNAELTEVNAEEREILQYEKLKEEAENQKILKQIGYESQEKAGSHVYVQNGIFPKQIFQKVEGFQKFVKEGYYEMIKRIKKTVLDVMKQKPEDRQKADVQDLLKKYLKQIPIFEPFDDTFFAQLQFDCTMESNFNRGQKIEIQPGRITIVYQGRAFTGPSGYDSCLPCHQVIDCQEIYNNVCGHRVECNCKNDLILFYIERQRFDNLAKVFWKRQHNLISVFLSHFDFIQTMQNDQVDIISQFTTTKVYQKDQMVFQEKDFPLRDFFMVRKGSVNLQRVVQIEQNNFIPTTLYDYQRRVLKKPVAHILGTVKVYQQFGLLEALTDCNASQMPCQFGTAGEDGTELIWMSRVDLVKPMNSQQITALLELLQSKESLVQNVPEQELILRSMCEAKLNELQKPRPNIIPNGETPSRVKKLDEENRKRTKTSKFNMYDLQTTAKPRATILRPLGNELEKGEMDKYEVMSKQDFKSKQNYIQSQKLVIATRAIDHLFDSECWIRY